MSSLEKGSEVSLDSFEVDPLVTGSSKDDQLLLDTMGEVFQITEDMGLTVEEVVGRLKKPSGVVVNCRTSKGELIEKVVILDDE